MNDKKFCSVSELAELVGVPRTTINDWLSRYNDYLESELRGKRRVYSERTVIVLKEIAALRENGKSGFEIDQSLAERHPVNPDEVTSAAGDAASPAAAASQPERGVTFSEPKTTLPAPAGPPGNTLSTALQLAENGRQFGEELRQVISALKTQHEKTERLLKAARRRNRRLLFAGVVALVILLTAIYFWGCELEDRYIEHGNDLSQQLSFEMATARSTWDTQRTRLESEMRAWEMRRQEDLETERNRSAAERAAREKSWNEQREREAAARLEVLSELERQKSSFQMRMEELRRTLSGQADAQMAQLRDDFSKRQAEYLKELESLRASNAELARAANQAAAAAREKAYTAPQAPVVQPPAVPVVPFLTTPENPAPDLKNP